MTDLTTVVYTALIVFGIIGLTLPKVAQCLADEVNYVDERYIKVID